MSCVESECLFHQEPEPKFAWFGTDTQKSFRCKITQKRIIRDHYADPVAIGANGSCHLKSGRCEMPAGLMLWTPPEETICPYEILQAIWFREYN
jgi:hypothetical protein